MTEPKPVVSIEPAPLHHGGARPAAGEPAANAFKVVQRLLRGRVLLTVLLAAVGAVVGAVLGYSAIKPKYETRGLIEVRPTLQKIIEETELSTPMPYFTNFVNKQVMLLEGDVVMSQAIASPDWLALGLGDGPSAQKLLRRAMRIDAPRESPELILVSCVHEDPRVTTVAVREIIRAYMARHAHEGAIDPATLDKVEKEKRECEEELKNLSDKIRQAAERAGQGTEDLTKEHQARHGRVLDLEAEVEALRLALVATGALGDTPPAVEPAPQTPREVSPLMIAQSDTEMASLLTRELNLERLIQTLRAQGFLANHPDLKRATADLQGTQAAIAKRAEDWKSAGGTPSSARGLSIVETPEQRLARYHNLSAELQRSRKELAEIDAARARLDQLVKERAFKEEELKTAVQRLRALQVETESGPMASRGRISVVTEGTPPSYPSVDKRKQLAAMGFVAGGGIPVGIMLLLGLVDRRFRYSDQAGELATAPPLLGILPVLPHELDNPEQRAVAAHCVHQVRLLLQIGGAHAGRKVYAITSPTAGDGKTSLALSLGLSFSAAGSRTLLIDFDMIGTGLSSNLRLDNGVNGPAEAPHGLAEVLRTGELNGSQVSLASDRLWVIPSRPEDEHQVSRLSAASVKRLIARVRDSYDVVIIDTGPMLGSLEAPLVCAEADGVVMVVGRGQQREYVDQAFARVGAVGGRVVGMVFNRATPGDFRRSVSSTSMRSVPRALPAPEAGHRPEADHLRDAGPVVRTMALELDAEADAGGLPRLDPPERA